MDGKLTGDLIQRDPRNPLITIYDLDFPCSDIHNAGIIKLAEDDYLMLVTIEMLEGITALYRARSPDGRHFVVDPKPWITRRDADADPTSEALGIKDARITPLDDTYYITYVANGPYGIRVGLAKTDDFEKVTRLGYITQPDTKNGVLLPTKINGKYVILTRPDPGASIWVSTSEDLEFWGEHEVVMAPRGGYWDSNRIGPAGPPILIDQGWLLIYYGEKFTSAGPLFRLGAAILDKDDPSQVISRSNIPILSPRERYERIGDLNNVIFSCGTIYDRGCVRVYYGGSDSCICMGQAQIDDILEICQTADREY